MEFWGVEIKPGKPLKVTPEEDYLIHISQASLGESKKGNESVPLFVKIGDQKLVLGTLTSEKVPQISCDLIFEQEFELSHNWKNGSVYVLGYKSPNMMEGGDDEIYSDFDDSEEEDIPVAPTANGKPKANPVKDETKPKAKAAEAKKDEADSDDEDDESDDSDEIDMDEDSEDEESDEETPKKATPKEAEQGKKRPNDSASAAKTPVQAKKAKIVTPQKSADGKKGGAQHSATPHPAKAGNKPSQSPKSGAQVSCGSCKKSFNSQVGLDSHNKAKHSAK